MAIITQNNDQTNELLTCVICARELSPAHMTAGMVSTQGEQQFACYGHSWDDSKLILGWAAVAARQGPGDAGSPARQADELYAERRPVTGNDVMSWDIAHHLFTRQLQGKVVVLTNNPAGLLSPLRKQWLRMTRKVQRERSSTLDAALIEQLARTISHMQSLSFTTKLPYEELNTDVYVLSDEQLREVPLDCHTIYVAELMADGQLTSIKEAMPSGGLMVVYK